jgi:hypothetical protein
MPGFTTRLFRLFRLFRTIPTIPCTPPPPPHPSPRKFFLAYNGVLRMYDDELLKVFRRCKELGAIAQVNDLLHHHPHSLCSSFL